MSRKREKAEKVKKEKVKTEKETKLLPLDLYLKNGVHLGTKVVMPHMANFVFRRRADKIAILDTTKIDERLRLAINLLSQFPPDKILVACKRESGWHAAETFGKVTGAKVFTKHFPPGSLTNPKLPDFFEPSLALLTDTWLDKIAYTECLKANVPIVALTDTNNLVSGIDLIVPCNNKTSRSLGLIFWLLAREYSKKRKLEVTVPPLEDFQEKREA